MPCEADPAPGNCYKHPRQKNPPQAIPLLARKPTDESVKPRKTFTIRLILNSFIAMHTVHTNLFTKQNNLQDRTIMVYSIEYLKSVFMDNKKQK